MAVQVKAEELDGCGSYFCWLAGKVTGKMSYEVPGEYVISADISAQLTPFRGLLRYLFGKDYRYIEAIHEDETRATDAMGLRRRYAEEVGAEAEKSERDIDRIWKSVHGKCSVLEFFLQLCIQMDAMVNEDEPESMVSMFFGLLLGNLGLNEADSEAVWEEKVDRFLDRRYEPDGQGGLFPLNGYVQYVSMDQRTVPIWDQMGAWLGEHLDEEEHFVCEKKE